MTPPFITRWDLDKTYLRTEFDTFRDLVRTAFEKAEEKRAVPGAAALLRALGETGARVHILSGSPRQMEGRLVEKLHLDRVRWDELTLKPNFSNMLRLRFRALRDQLGYKLPVLLEARARDQAGGPGGAPREILVGDDAEADAFVYSLYADICAGRVGLRELEETLRAGRVYSDQRDTCLAAFEALHKGPVVDRILIHLDRQSPPSLFDQYGGRVVPFFNYLQAAFVLLEDERLDGVPVLEVAASLVLRHRFDAEALGRSYLDLMRRGHAQGTALAALRGALGALPDESAAALPHLSRMVDLVEGYLAGAAPPRRDEPVRLAYVDLAARHQGGKNRKKFRSFAN